jgi:hypothetical protein
MQSELPEAFAAMIERDQAHAPERYRSLSGSTLRQAIKKDILGVLLVQYHATGFVGVRQ